MAVFTIFKLPKYLRRYFLKFLRLFQQSVNFTVNIYEERLNHRKYLLARAPICNSGKTCDSKTSHDPQGALNNVLDV